MKHQNIFHFLLELLAIQFIAPYWNVVNGVPTANPDPSKFVYVTTIEGKEFYNTLPGSGGFALPWVEAMQFCHRYGMSLAKFTNRRDLEEVQNLISQIPSLNGARVWIGGNIISKFRMFLVPSGEYKWVSDATPVASELWSVGQPSRAISIADDNQYEYDSCTGFISNPGNDGGLSDFPCFGGIMSSLCMTNVDDGVIPSTSQATTSPTQTTPPTQTTTVQTTLPTTTTTTTAPTTVTTTTPPPVSGNCGIRNQPAGLVVIRDRLTTDSPVLQEFWRVDIFNVEYTENHDHPHNIYITDSRTGTSYWLSTTYYFLRWTEEQGPDAKTVYKNVKFSCLDGTTVEYQFQIEMAY